MIRTIPLRRMTRHFSHRLVTEAETFITCYSSDRVTTRQSAVVLSNRA